MSLQEDFASIESKVDTLEDLILKVFEELNGVKSNLLDTKQTVETNKKLQNRTCVSLSRTDKKLYKCQRGLNRHDEVFKNAEKMIFENRERLESSVNEIKESMMELTESVFNLIDPFLSRLSRLEKIIS